MALDTSGAVDPSAPEASSAAPESPPGALVRATWVATAVLVIVYLASTVLRREHATSALWDGWVGNAGYAGCAVLVAQRVVARRRDRVGWTALGCSLVLFTGGAILWTTTVQFWDEIPYPSIADACFLLFYPVAFAAVGLLIRGEVPRVGSAVWSDGLIAALGVAALEASLVIAPISHGTKGDAATVATNLAYPIGDLVLVMMVVGAFAMSGWRPGRMLWLLGAGLVIFAAADSVYVLRVTAGTYETGTWLDSLWLVGTFMMATSAWLHRPIADRADVASPPLVIPAAFLVSSLAIVVYASWGNVLPLGVALATGALLATAVRLAQVHRHLRALEAQSRGLLEAAPDAILCVDSEGRIVLSNAQAASLFRYEKAGLVGQQIEVLIPAAAREASAPDRLSFDSTATQPMRRGALVEARRRDGTTFPAEVSLSALETPGGVVVSATVRDLTDQLAAQAEREALLAQAERDRLESQVHKSQQLESLGQLAGGVAHDFNNLLSAIKGYGSLVADEVAAGAAEHGGERWLPVMQDLGEIDKAANRAAQLTQQLLAFARRDVTRPAVLDINAVVTEVERLLRRTIGADVGLRTALDATWRVFADQGQIEQVLLNLAINARDAMPVGGELTIRTDDHVVDASATVAHPDLVPGRYVRVRRERHRGRHGPGDARAGLRALLHDEARGAGDRPRAGHRVRHREPGGGSHSHRVGCRSGLDDHGAAPGDRAAGGRGRRGAGGGTLRSWRDDPPGRRRGRDTGVHAADARRRRLPRPRRRRRSGGSSSWRRGTPA